VPELRGAVAQDFTKFSAWIRFSSLRYGTNESTHASFSSVGVFSISQAGLLDVSKRFYQTNTHFTEQSIGQRLRINFTPGTFQNENYAVVISVNKVPIMSQFPIRTANQIIQLPNDGAPYPQNNPFRVDTDLTNGPTKTSNYCQIVLPFDLGIPNSATIDVGSYVPITPMIVNELFIGFISNNIPTLTSF
jgi:hypothetical protein